MFACALLRVRHSNDGKVYRVTSPWDGRSKHFTREFKGFAVTLMREMPMKRAGQILGESDTRMWWMLFAHVKAPHKRVELRQRGVDWCRQDEQAQRSQVPDGVRGHDDQAGALGHSC